MSVKLLTEHNLEFVSLKRGCTGSSESTHVKMPHCWKSHVTTHIFFNRNYVGIPANDITLCLSLEVSEKSQVVLDVLQVPC